MKFKLKVVTPEKLFFEGEVDQVIARGAEGEFAILAKHVPFVTQLQIAKAVIKNDHNEEVFAVAGGYIHVGNEETVIVSDACEYAKDIDVTRAEAAKLRAESRIKQNVNEIDITRAEISLRKALNRIHVANNTTR